MYGTTMIAKLAPKATADEVRASFEDWQKERDVPGFVSAHIMIGNDDRTLVNVAVFESKEAYDSLADDPEQDKWWQTRMAPLLDGDPQWIDGSWVI